MVVSLLVLLVFGAQHEALLGGPVIEIVCRDAPTLLKSDDRF